MSSGVARFVPPAVGAGVVLATFQAPTLVLSAALLLATLAASIRIAGEREWSLLPQGVLAAVLIAPEAWMEILAIALVSTATAVAAKPERWSTTAIGFLSASTATALVVWIPSSVATELEQARVSWESAVWLAALGIAWFIADTLLWLGQEPDLRVVYRDSVRKLLGDWRVAAILISATVAVAALWHTSPAWALGSAVLPLLLAMQLASQVGRHRRLVDLTVQALGRLPEAAGVAQRGHSKNVTMLAVAMGQVGGFGGRELETLRRAAFLHDVGLVEATRSEIGAAGFTTADISMWSATLLAENDEFRREAAVITAMSDPYRVPGSDPLSEDRAQIIRAACRAITMLEVDPVDQVVESLYADSIYTFDPRAVSLIRPAIELLGWPALPRLA